MLIVDPSLPWPKLNISRYSFVILLKSACCSSKLSVEIGFLEIKLSIASYNKGKTKTGKKRNLKAPSKVVGNKRRKSFCARMKGMKKKLTSAKTARDPNSRINKSLRAWNC